MSSKLNASRTAFPFSSSRSTESTEERRSCAQPISRIAPLNENCDDDVIAPLLAEIDRERNAESQPVSVLRQQSKYPSQKHGRELQQQPHAAEKTRSSLDIPSLFASTTLVTADHVSLEQKPLGDLSNNTGHHRRHAEDEEEYSHSLPPSPSHAIVHRQPVLPFHTPYRVPMTHASLPREEMCTEIDMFSATAKQQQASPQSPPASVTMLAPEASESAFTLCSMVTSACMTRSARNAAPVSPLPSALALATQEHSVLSQLNVWSGQPVPPSMPPLLPPPRPPQLAHSRTIAVFSDTTAPATQPTAAADPSSRDLRRQRYKTTQCINFMESGGNCRFGALCAFLHGCEDEQRFLIGGDVLRHSEFDRTEALRLKCSAREQARRARQQDARCNPKQFPFSCELCQVRTNTEQSLHQHFRGRAHRTSLIKLSMAADDIARFHLLDGPSQRAFIDQQYGDRPIVALDDWLERNGKVRKMLHSVFSANGEGEK